VVDILLDRKADPNIQNDKGSTALYWAVRYGHTECVRKLIDKGKADVNQTRKLGLVSPIIVASALGYKDIVEKLISAGVLLGYDYWLID
jgi:serine/threonine-protein phosphatase 6 regulatory ankyrin repeat subunit B